MKDALASPLEADVVPTSTLLPSSLTITRCPLTLFCSLDQVNSAANPF